MAHKVPEGRASGISRRGGDEEGEVGAGDSAGAEFFGDAASQKFAQLTPGRRWGNRRGGVGAGGGGFAAEMAVGEGGDGGRHGCGVSRRDEGAGKAVVDYVALAAGVEGDRPGTLSLPFDECAGQGLPFARAEHYVGAGIQGVYLRAIGESPLIVIFDWYFRQ